MFDRTRGPLGLRFSSIPWVAGGFFWLATSPALASRTPTHATSVVAPREWTPSELLYLSIEGGSESVNLTSLRSVGGLPAGVPDEDRAAYYGLAAGVRLGFLTLGARYRDATFTAWSLSTLEGELGARVTLGPFEPYFSFGAGYASLSTGVGASVGQSGLAGLPNVSVHGPSARAGLGIDWYADPSFTLGIQASGTVLALARTGVSLTTSPQKQAEEKAASCLQQGPVGEVPACLSRALSEAEGSSFGFASTYSVVMGLHF